MLGFKGLVVLLGLVVFTMLFPSLACLTAFSYTLCVLCCAILQELLIYSPNSPIK